MTITLVSCVYSPEPSISSQMCGQIAFDLRERGHSVIVLAPVPNRPSGTIYPGYRRALFSRKEDIKGIEVIRCFSILSPRSSALSRFFENITFGFTSGLFVLFSRSPDVIYSNSWPIFATGLLWIAAKIRRIPIVLSMQDIYPESFVSQQRLHERHLLVKFMARIDGIIARHSEAIIVISQSFARIYREIRRVPNNRIHFVPNWIDEGLIIPNDERAKVARLTAGIPENAFLAVYAGNVGVAANVELIIESFRNIQREEEIFLLIAGEGANYEECQSLAKQIDPKRIVFHRPFLLGETSMVLSAADILVLPTRGGQTNVSVPSKVMSYMFSQKPILALALPNTDLAKSIQESGCGWVIEPDRPDLIAAKLQEIAGMNKRDLLERGRAGRNYARINYSKESNLARVVRILESIDKHD